MYKYVICSIFLLVVFFNSIAQKNPKHPDVISQEEILMYQEHVKKNNISLEQVEAYLSARGMSQSEIDMFKSQLSESKNIKKAEPVKVVPREMPQSDYKTFTKPPSSNVFGSSFFTTPSLSFEPNLRIATPASYVLGPDDELLISISGYQEADLQIKVQPEGTISIPQVGLINVAGLTMDEAINRIRNKMIQTAYPNIRNGLTKLNVSLGKIRSIRITIIGAVKPGNYTVSSLTTVFNSLFLCGGPDSINTYREIELIRNNIIYRKIDLYQFLTKGDLSGNVLLKENDVINFPVYKKRVTMSGQIKRGGTFELLENETLEKLLFFAGGFTNKAYKASIKIKQDTETERHIKNISKTEYASHQLSNGDEVIVDAIPDRLENGVVISGAVYRPGQFELTPGLTVGALLKKAGGLKHDAFLDRGIISRLHEDRSRESISFQLKDILSGKNDVLLQKWDTIQIASVKKFMSDYIVHIEGEVRAPGDYPYRNNLSLKDVLFLAGSFTEAGTPYNIEVSRRLTKDGLGEITDSIARVFTVNTDKDLSFHSDSFVLEPYDIITVRRSPGYKEQKRVTINGEVLYPGVYTIPSKSSRISDLLKRAGGFTSSAYLEGVSLTRNIGNITATDTIRKQRIQGMQQSIKDTSERVIRDVTSSNVKIAVNTGQVLKKPGSNEDYVLEEGDIIEVAKLDPLVKVSGEVLLVSKTHFEKRKPLKYYLRRAGGTTDKAKLSRIYVVYANGELDRTKRYLLGFIRSYPEIKTGSEIVVPARIERRRLTTSETIGLTSALVSILSLVVVTINSMSN